MSIRWRHLHYNLFIMILAHKKNQLTAFTLVFVALSGVFLGVLLGLLWPGVGNALNFLPGRAPESLAFSFVALMVMLAFQLQARPGLTVAAIVLFVTLIFEGVQVWTPFREASLTDWLTNLLAGFGGIIIGLWLGRLESLLQSQSQP
ncbi:hypothetical protein [Wenzhouxiangella limi]|uniref:VanZ-like domain-containing protein n=1 Tax=Wenzhouxiangella limi TaxID=2707351 RepID=A0A845UYG4_9GAMM|nr:hypothetical protein [Wenzhouxiangella limi]NDY95292.1 hypothetical protein [Wenzhouxiangella limi]